MTPDPVLEEKRGMPRTTWRSSSYSLDVMRANWLQTCEYAEWILYWESLPHADREALKQQRSREYLQQQMELEAPTQPQLDYLQGLGYTGPIESKRHASSLIDVLKRGGRVV